MSAKSGTGPMLGSVTLTKIMTVVPPTDMTPTRTHSAMIRIRVTDDQVEASPRRLTLPVWCNVVMAWFKVGDIYNIRPYDEHLAGDQTQPTLWYVAVS
ncbi:hypothetical protein GCM10009720_05160 [Yaniella flava]|uniref:Uncharacterized protein n=1 Tax=Yaniella flava TaxID=287930 RepID=A0ABP5FKC1_9MICC